MTHCCQLCGQPTDNPFATIYLSPFNRKVLHALPGTIDELADRVYGPVKNDTIYNQNSLRTIIHRIRSALEPIGWTINNDLPEHGRKKTYRLVRLPVR